MDAGAPDELRSWTARHGSALRQLVSAHAEFVNAVSGALGPAVVEADARAKNVDKVRTAAAAAQLRDACEVVAALPPAPDPEAQRLLERLLRQLRNMADTADSQPTVLRTAALRSSLAVVELIDRLLETPS